MINSIQSFAGDFAAIAYESIIVSDCGKVYLFVNICKDPSLLSKASVYLTDHSTVMLKIIIGNTTSSVDIGREEFTYAIVNTKTAKTRMGRGHTDDIKTMKEFFNLLRK